MKKSTYNHKNNIINKYKLMYIPFIVGILAILIVSIAVFFVSKKLLFQQMKQDSLNLTKQTAAQIKRNATSLNIIDKMLENRIGLFNKAPIQHKNSLSNNNPLIKEPKLNDMFRTPLKFQRFKNINDTGISKANIHTLTESLNYKNVIEDLTKRDNIVYACVVDKDLKTITNTIVGDIQAKDTMPDYTKNLNKTLKNNITTSEWYYNKIDADVLSISVPIIIDKKILGAVTIGFSTKNVYSALYTIFTAFRVTISIMFLLFIWIQRKNVIKPLIQLNNNINNIDIEKNTGFKLPLIANDTFLGLTYSINSILDKTYNYFYELTESKEELNASNEEISATYQQLLASEEELRAQYDEIQCYAQKLESLKQKYEIAIEYTNIAIWEINTEDRSVYLSKEFENIIGIPNKEKEDIYSVLEKILTTEDREKLVNEYIQYKNGIKEDIYSQLQVRDNKGNLKWLLLSGKGIYNRNKKSNLINGIVLDITKLKVQENYIEHLAFHDHLTSLPNRMKFMEKFREELNKNQTGAVILLDLDNFKGINDILGHVYGDNLLKKVAEELTKIKDEKMFISRFGGDEFLVLISGEKDIEKINDYVKKIINIFDNKLMIENDEIHINCSMGISLYPSDSNEINQLIMNADMAMYKVKTSGKNNYMFFNEEMTTNLKNKIQIEKILREALNENGFKLLYQPQICTYIGNIVGFEALLRLKNYNISPDVFIPVAEETGLISDIGRWVTKEVVQQLAIWKNKNYEQKPVAINFSLKQLNDLNYIEFLSGLLKEHNVEAKYIDIEITESIFLEKKQETVEFLNKLKLLGVKISLDDFGTGYSSLSYLTFLPVDKIKLDRTLSNKFLEDEENTVIDNIISLSHSLKLKVVAEGVERLDQFNRLKKGSCDYIQGYIFSKPIDVEEIDRLYNTNFFEKIIENKPLAL